MEFSFSEEQEMIRESADAFLTEVSSSEAIRQAMATELGYDAKVWQRISEDMVWPAIHIPEEFGGMGLGYVELVVLLELMGKHLLCSPFFSTVCLAANALLVSGNQDQKEKYLPKIAEGSLNATLGYISDSSGWGSDAIKTTYKKDGDSYTLNGNYRYVSDGFSADLIIVAAREAGSEGENGISLFILEAETKGLHRDFLPTMDQTKKQAALLLNNVQVPAENLLGEAGNAWGDLEKILQLANISVAAEQFGGAQRVLDLTVDYTKERVQFNKPIAGFQAVKHKAADMMVKAECAKSAVYYAACIAQDFFEQGDLSDELAEAASLAKAYCSDAYFFNAGSAIQLFGGVGITWEYDVHLYFKRAKSSETFLGNGACHRERIASILLD